MAATETAGLDAEVLLRHVLGLDRVALFTHLTEEIGSDQLRAYQALIGKRAEGAPVAYLTEEREFMGLPFAVTPGVLVPRPETEILVEWAIGWLRTRGSVTVVDVGTGSGAIALSIAAYMGQDWPGRTIAVDVSSEALAVARRNRVRLGLQDRVEICQASLLAWRAEPVDLLLANLPYLRPGQIAENSELRFEPVVALDGGPDGLDLIRSLLQDAPRVMSPGGALGVEIDPGQREPVVTLARQLFPGSTVSVLRDLAGFDRHMIVENAGRSTAP